MNAVMVAYTMRPRCGSFTIPLARDGYINVFDGFVYQTVKRWWGRDGEEIDISGAEADHP